MSDKKYAGAVDVLKRAAAKLRTEAEVAGTNEWCPDYMWAGIRHLMRNCDLEVECDKHPEDFSGSSKCGGPDMYAGRYVALMYPPVALALATTMEKVAWMGGLDSDFLARVGHDELIACAYAVLREEPAAEESKDGEAG
jgi:hypothetical protein